MSIAAPQNASNVRRVHSSTAMSQFASTPNLFSSVPTVQVEGECLALFAVFDGHAGYRCSKFMREHFSKLFFDLKATRRGEIPVGLYKAFLKAEAQFCQVAKVAGWNDGSTGVVSVVHGHQLTLAHIGDSRAVLCRGKTAIELTADHKPDRPDEQERITSLGGTVERAEMGGSIARVNGHLAVSRAFGDIRMKESQRYVSAEPEISVVTLNPEDKFIVLASDGLWDVLTNQEVVDFIRKDSVKHKAAKNLVKRALRIGTTDNITALVVWLTWVGNTPVPLGLSSSSSGQLMSTGASTAPLPQLASDPPLVPTPSPASTPASTPASSEPTLAPPDSPRLQSPHASTPGSSLNPDSALAADSIPDSPPKKTNSKDIYKDKPSKDEKSKEKESKDQRKDSRDKEPKDKEHKHKSASKSKEPSGSPPTPLPTQAPLEETA
jgi:protein phosphatase 1L